MPDPDFILIMPLPPLRRCEAFATIDQARARFRQINARVVTEQAAPLPPGGRPQLTMHSGLFDGTPICLIMADRPIPDLIAGPGAGRAIEIPDAVYKATWTRFLRMTLGGEGRLQPDGVTMYQQSSREPAHARRLHPDGTDSPYPLT